MQENKESIQITKHYAICSVAAAPVRKENTHRSEMVNQLVYGEAVEVLEEKDEWRYIRSLFDEYEGWVTFHLITLVEASFGLAKDFSCTKKLITEWEPSVDEKMYLPMGAFLRGAQNDNINKPGQLPQNELTENIIETAKEWLHVPYLWGGKTAMGVDCSGFVQTVFKVHGIRLRRDAFLQADQGVLVGLSEASIGDVAFFNNDAGRVTHVGILLNNHQIIHAAGKVRIDTIDERGIQNSVHKKQTHQLHSIKRLIS